MIASHMDDLLFGGSKEAEDSLLAVGNELGFRDISRNSFTWCGKQFERRDDGSVAITMKPYHENLKEIFVPKHRKADLMSSLTSQELRQLRALGRSFSGWWLS